MATDGIIKLQGLRGIEGLKGLSQQEFSDWRTKNLESIKSLSFTQQDRLYRNELFMNEFQDLDLFKKLSPEQRDEYYKEHLVNKSIQSYKDDPNFSTIENLTPDGKIELLENSRYHTPEDISSKVESAKKTARVTGFLPNDTPVYTYEDKSEETQEDLLKNNEKVLESIYSKDLERKKATIAPSIQEIENNITENIASGKISVDEIKGIFEKITEGTHYQQLKDSNTFKDFGEKDMIREVATYMAASQSIDPTTGWQMIRNDMQNYTNDNMPLINIVEAGSAIAPWLTPVFKDYLEKNPTKFGNFKRDINTQIWSDIGSTLVAIEGLTKLNNEEKENWLNGLDENGNELPFLRSPMYWQSVNNYNTLNPDKIKQIQQTGGVSPYVNVTQAGDELEFFNATNITNSLSQAIGQAVPLVVGGGIGTIANKMATRALGSTMKTLAWNTLKYGANISSMIPPIVANGHKEGYEVYQNMILDLQQQTDSRINEAIKKTIEEDINTEEGKLEIAKIKKTLEEEIRSKYKSENTPYIINNEYLEELAKQQYIQNRESFYRPKIESFYENLEKEGREDAARTAYTTTMGIHTIKNAVFDLALDRVFMSKGARQFFSDNSLLKFKPKQYIDNTGNIALEELTKTKKFANALIEGAEQFTGELTDAWVNSLGENIGLNKFNNFVDKTYNPEDYVELNDNYLSYFMEGLSDLPDDMFTKEALFEGWAGLISSFAPGFNPSAAIKEGRGKSFRTDEFGNKLSVLESLNKYITNPLLGAYYEYNPQEREFKTRLDAVKKVLSDNTDNLNKVTELMTAISTTDKESQEGSLLSTMTAKHNEVVRTAFLLNDLGEDELLALHSQYRNADALAENIVNNNLSNEDKQSLIDSYLNRSDNKSISTQSSEEAWQQIQDNAKKFSEVRSYITTRYNQLNKDFNTRNLSDNSKRQLIAIELQNQNLESRSREMSKEIGVTYTTKDTSNTIYGNKNNYERKKKDIQERININTQEINNTQEEIKNIKKNIKKATSEQEKQLLSDKLKSLEIKEKVLHVEKNDLKVENNNIKSLEDHFNTNKYAKTLSQDEILSLSAEDRAFILNPDNKYLYSPEQQKIIDNTISDLRQKDINALDKIRDLGTLQTALKDNKKAYSSLRDNLDALDMYVNQRINYRINNIVKAKIQSSANELSNQIGKYKQKGKITSIAKDWSTPVIDAYIESHPEKKDLLQEARDIAQLREDATSLINKDIADKNVKDTLRNYVTTITKDYNNKKDILKQLESLLDNLDIQYKEQLEALLKGLQDLGYQRNSTILKAREKNKKRQEKLTQEESERNKKKEEIESKIETPKQEEVQQEETIPTAEDYTETGEVDLGLIEEIVSPTLQEEIIENPNIEVIVHELDKEDKAEIDNTQVITPENTIMLSNPYYRYVIQDLKSFGRMSMRSTIEGDKLSTIWKWFDSMNIDLQGIVDNELHKIKALNADVQYLFVKPEDNATNDSSMSQELLQVVEYTDKVKTIHDNSKGGVITANGKQWLVVGIQRWSNPKQMDLFNSMAREMRNSRDNYFKSNPTERFFVDNKYKTKIADIAPGRLVRQMLDDEASEIRSIVDLINDPKRNPKRLKLENLKWGIQTYTDFATVNISKRNKVYTPKDIVGNAGSVFVLIESANGGYIPAKIIPTMFNEIKDSKFKNDLYDKLYKLLSSNHEERLKAIKSIVSTLVLDKDNNILIGTKDNNVLSIKKDGIITKTFDLNKSDFTTQEFLNAISELNPRIQISISTLSNVVNLKELNDAGALNTDIAYLGTVNANHYVYACDDNGTPIEDPTIGNTPPTSDYNRKDEHSVLHLGKVYREVEGSFYNDKNIIITDPTLISQLKYLQRIKVFGLQPIKIENNTAYYVINPYENLVVAVEKGTNRVTSISKDRAKSIIEQSAREAKEKERENNAKNTLQETEINLDLQESDNEDITGYSESMKVEEKAQKPIVSETPKETKNESGLNKPTVSFTDTTSEQSFNLVEILDSTEYGDRINDIIDSKIDSGDWQNVPDDLKELEDYLNNMGIITVGISDVDTWLDLIQNCK